MSTNTELKWYVVLYYNFFVGLPVIILLGLISFVYVGYLYSYIFVLWSVENYDETNFPLILTTSLESSISKGNILFYLITILFILLITSLLRTVFMNPGYFNSIYDMEHKIVLSQCIKEKHNKLPITNALTADEIILQSTYINKQELHKDSDLESELSIISHNKTKLKNKKNNINIVDFTNYEIDDRIAFLNDFHDICSSGPVNHREQQELNSKITDFLSEDKKQALDTSDLTSSTLSNSEETDELTGYMKNIELNKALLCGTCLRFKVERSHHCRQCGKCILKMDHHCPWLANCIGFRNYKYFLLIEFHGTLASIVILFTLWESILGFNNNADSSIEMCWFVSFVYFCSIGLFGFLLWLMMINWKLVFTGQTVIENSDRERFPLNKNINIYDLGYYKNFTSVFGTNPLFWFLPFNANYKGYGIYYDNIYNSVKQK